MLEDYPETKKEILKSLKKAGSHMATIEKMVHANRYCIDILQQLKAVHGLLHLTMDQTLELHLKSCFKEGMESTDEKKKKELIAEIIKVTKIANK